MKKIYLLFVALIGAFSLNAGTYYLAPNDNWKQADARFAVYGFNEEGSTGWTDMAKVDGSSDIYKAEVDELFTTIIFCRMNPATAENNFNQDVCWDQTNNLPLSEAAGNDLYTIATGVWSYGAGAWSLYGQGSNPGGNPGENPGENPGGNTPEGNPRFYWKAELDGTWVQPDDNISLFVNGRSSIAFQNVAYFFLVYQVDGVLGVQYMATEWFDNTHTHATFAEAGTEKWSLPVGTTELYLYDNEDGTVEVSNTPMPGKKLWSAAGPIEAVERVPMDNNAPMYNILGMPVDKTYRGIILRNGHKYIQL